VYFTIFGRCREILNENFSLFAALLALPFELILVFTLRLIFRFCIAEAPGIDLADVE
jgi:hypothetical protein